MVWPWAAHVVAAQLQVQAIGNPATNSKRSTLAPDFVSKSASRMDIPDNLLAVVHSVVVTVVSAWLGGDLVTQAILLEGAL